MPADTGQDDTFPPLRSFSEPAVGSPPEPAEDDEGPPPCGPALGRAGAQVPVSRS